MEIATSADFIVPASASLGITSIGRSDTMFGHFFGPSARPFYLIHYIISGSGTFEVNNIAYHLHAGQGFLIEPNYRTTYTADQETPWSYIWIGFAGNDAQQLIDQIKISEMMPVFDNVDSFGLVNCVNGILSLKELSPANNLLAQSYLLRFLSYIANSTLGKLSLPTSSQSSYVTVAIDYIGKNLSTISVDKLARGINVNRSYLAELFKKDMDLSPSEYIRNFRITKARHLLESSVLSIDNIAEQCG